MKKKHLLIAMLCVITVGAIVVLDHLSRKSAVSLPANADEVSNEVGEVTAGEESKSRYVTFSPEELNNVANGRRVLFFYANWCPTCRPVDQSLTENSLQLPEDVTVIRVNYNDNQTDQAEKDLAQNYGVTYQHTFVQVDTEGNEVTKWNGGQFEDILTNIQ